MPPDGFATWTDYWNSLADIQNENNPSAGGNPNEYVSPPPETVGPNSSGYGVASTSGQTGGSAPPQGIVPQGNTGPTTPVIPWGNMQSNPTGWAEYSIQQTQNLASQATQAATNPPGSENWNATQWNNYYKSQPGGVNYQPPAQNTGGFTPITNPGFTRNNVGTGPIQQDPGSANYGNPIQTNYNPNLYADDATAQRIAQQLGGTVVKGDPVGLGASGSPFSAPQGNMIKLPNGRTINAGTIANYEQLYANNPQMLQAMVNGEITGTGQNPQAYQNNLSGWNPAQVAAANFTVNRLPPGSVVSGGSGATGGGAGGGSYNTGGTGGGGTQGGGTPAGNQRDPSISQGLIYRPPPRNQGGTPSDGTTPPPNTGGGFPYVNPYSDPYGFGYPQVGAPKGMPYGTGAMGGFPTKQITNPDGTTSTVPDWSYKPTSNVGDMMQNAMSYAYGQGGELIGNYGDLMAQENQRANQLAATGDSMYANLMANPGYTQAQYNAIMNQPGLNALNWTQDMAQQNFLTGTMLTNPDGSPQLDANGNPQYSGEMGTWAGDPYKAYNQYTSGNSVPIMDANGNVQRDANGNIQYQSNADYLNQLARQYGGNLSNIYDEASNSIFGKGGDMPTMGTALSNAIDPARLGLSSQFTTNYNWTPQDSQNIINAAGRNVGMGTAATVDQLQRQAAAAGTNSPLALAAALARQRQTGDVAASDAMTNAAIQAKQNELQVQQQLEQMRLGTQQDISTRQMQEATTMGQSGIAAKENILAGRSGAALQTGLQQMNEQNTIAGQEASLTQAGEIAAQQRAQAMAQNRQQISQANQAAQFQRGSYTDQAESQRATQAATAARADQTQARQDVRNEEQTGYNEANSGMAGQLQTFGNVTGAQAASSANAIKAAQLPTTLDKVIGAGVSAVQGEGGIVTKPTKAVVGEKGPELIIKLKHPNGSTMTYRRRNEAAYA